MSRKKFDHGGDDFAGVLGQEGQDSAKKHKKNLKRALRFFLSFLLGCIIGHFLGGFLF